MAGISEHYSLIPACTVCKQAIEGVEDIWATSCCSSKSCQEMSPCKGDKETRKMLAANFPKRFLVKERPTVDSDKFTPLLHRFLKERHFSVEGLKNCLYNKPDRLLIVRILHQKNEEDVHPTQYVFRKA